MKFQFRSAAALAIVGLVLSVTTACVSSTESAISSKGSDEMSGTVYWYSGNSPARNEAVVEAFNKQQPDVRIEVLRGVTGDLTVRYAQERESGASTADVISQTDPIFIETGFENDWWNTTVEAAAGWPKEVFNNGTALTSYHVLELGINTDMASESDFESWEDLLDPSLKGRLLLLDPRSDPGYLSILQLWSELYGDDFLTSLAAQEPRFVPSNVPGSEALASGSADVMAPIGRTGAQPQIDAGAPLKVLPISPTVGIEFHTSVSSNSPNPVAAEAFFEFLTTKEGQEAFSGTLTVSPRPDAEGTLPMPEDLVSLSEVLPKANERKDELLSLIGIE